MFYWTFFYVVLVEFNALVVMAFSWCSVYDTSFIVTYCLLQTVGCLWICFKFNLMIWGWSLDWICRHTDLQTAVCSFVSSWWRWRVMKWCLRWMIMKRWSRLVEELLVLYFWFFIKLRKSSKKCLSKTLLSGFCYFKWSTMHKCTQTLM